jgi:hypothetical protein
VTRAFLEATGIKFAYIDCAETISSALLFYRIVRSLRRMAVEESMATTADMVRIGGDVNGFVVEVQRAMDKLQGKIVLVFLPLRLCLLVLSKVCLRGI